MYHAIQLCNNHLPSIALGTDGSVETATSCLFRSSGIWLNAPDTAFTERVPHWTSVGMVRSLPERSIRYRSVTCPHFSTSQIRIVFSGSRLPLAILRPSGLTASATTGLSCPSMIPTTFLLPTSQMTIFPFSDPLISQACAFCNSSTFIVSGSIRSGLGKTIAGHGKRSDT